jgi:cyclase
MVAKRIIPCLDIKAGRTVKGVTFQNMIDVGDPIELAARYSDEGADELVFLDISATDEERATTVSLVRRVAEQLLIPFTVGGGVRSVNDARRLLEAGADKVSVNSAAVRRPELVEELACEFGSQCVVVAVDSKRSGLADEVVIQAGKVSSGRTTLDWIKEACERGAGEILLTSVDHDGTRAGYALELTRVVSEMIGVPVVASGGAGAVSDFRDVFIQGHADGALASSVFHNQLLSIGVLKSFLISAGVEVRA